MSRTYSNRAAAFSLAALGWFSSPRSLEVAPLASSEKGGAQPIPTVPEPLAGVAF